MEQSCCASIGGAPMSIRPLMSPDKAPPGSGLLLVFRVDDFDMALKTARSLVTRLEEEPHVNPNTQTASSLSVIRTDITPPSVRWPPGRSRPDRRVQPTKARLFATRP